MEDKNKKLTDIAMNRIMNQNIEETISKAKQDKRTNEINNILKELPIEENESKIKETKLPKILSNKYFIYGAIAVVVLILLLALWPSTPDCPVINNQSIISSKGGISFDMVKQQILTNGYAEITDGSLTIKLAPYIK